jgi:hypothetical protein
MTGLSVLEKLFSYLSFTQLSRWHPKRDFMPDSGDELRQCGDKHASTLYERDEPL